VTGAGGTIGVGTMAASEADDYTIGVINVSTNVIAPAVRDNLTYDAQTSFEYIAMLGGAPTVIAVNPDVGINTLDDSWRQRATRRADGLWLARDAHDVQPRAGQVLLRYRGRG
jgi:tripartite-type tricarboxylate transporter receptor subunit TctC